MTEVDQARINLREERNQREYEAHATGIETKPNNNMVGPIQASCSFRRRKP